MLVWAGGRVTVGYNQIDTNSSPTRPFPLLGLLATIQDRYVAHTRSPPVHGSHSSQNRDPFSPRMSSLPGISIRTKFLCQSAGSGEGLAPLVNFYSKLPKGRAPPAAFDPEKKALNRLGLTILFFFGVGYTIDYNSTFSPPWTLRTIADKTPPSFSALE